MENSAFPVNDDAGRSRSSADPSVSLEQVRSALRGLRYGEVRVVVQDGVIVQIERLDKQRLR